MKEFETTTSGFKVYGRVKDARGCEVRVLESSACGASRIYIFTKDLENVYQGKPADPYLSARQAAELIVILEDFVRDATDRDNWRNDPKYIEVWGDGTEDS